MIPNSVTKIGDDAFDSCEGLTDLTIGDHVASIGLRSFYGCTSLASATISKTVTNIEFYAFGLCQNLTGIYFNGNAPSVVDSTAFTYDYFTTAYYLPGTTGWGSTFAGVPTMLWSPKMHPGTGLGVLTNQFGFNIHWADSLAVIVEACTNLANPVWTPLGTNALTQGSSYFSDPRWTNHPNRFYRLRSQ